jgi:predicted AAA+ superfamily ATPase
VTITGPRHAGKTTLVQKLFPERQYINLENPDLFQRFVRLCAGRIGQIFNSSHLSNKVDVVFKSGGSLIPIEIKPVQTVHADFWFVEFYKDFSWKGQSGIFDL